MTFPRRTLRLFLAGAVGLPLAVISGAHALSSASLRRSPELALSVFPANGLAAEKIAYRAFVKSVKDSYAGLSQETEPARDTRADINDELEDGPSDLQAFAGRAAKPARDALTLEPLLPKAYALVALAQEDPIKRRKVISLASRLNRRELSLQGLVLQQKANDGDYSGAINTLDEILRVHPERGLEFFPLLVDALLQKEARLAFSRLLGTDLPWRDAFLGFAVSDQRTLDNLAAIRKVISLDNIAFDQRLIAGLVAQGKIEAAADIYSLAAPSKQQQGEVSWQSDYPPFDWKLTDTAGFRAEANKSLSGLEFSIEPGNGGILASKLIPAPEVPFEIRIAHDIDPLAQTKDLKLKISCSGQAAAFFEEPFAVGESIFKVGTRPNCRYLTIDIVGRAWTGSNAINGRIMAFELKSL